jgi:hypothetical protein
LWGFSALRSFNDRFERLASKALAFVEASMEEAEEEGADGVGGAENNGDQAFEHSSPSSDREPRPLPPLTIS